ncbi:MAG: discoidin domain-containing protein [Ruminococcus sp.]|nr:discoidin domain-containing protein [Ruminococcus sp.]
MNISFTAALRRAAAAVCGAVLALSAAPSALPAEVQAAQAVHTDVSKDIGLVGNLFCISGSDNADHAELQWATTLKADSFTLYRSTSPDTGFEEVYHGGGASWEDNTMQLGSTYYYQLGVDVGGKEYYSSVKSLEPVRVPEGLSTYDNQKGSSLYYETNGYKVGDTYYSYSLKKHSGQNDIYLAETTSRDGRNFGSERNVADSSQNSDLASCKIESVHIDYVPEKNKVVVWAHWEKPSGYSDGKALVITGTPGGQFTVHHVYNPLGIQVRDMAIFFDDDGTGYLIAAANKEGQGANATMYIFRMNDDYSGVTEVVKTLFEDQYREFPNLVKHDGHYFLFTSQAAGWYPSSGAYSVTDNLAGEWSGLRNIGNSSTFSSQSGWIVDLKGKNYLMHAYRWLRANSTSGTTLCPLYFDNGFAFYDYCPSFRYNTSTGDLYPVQEGELLSQDKPTVASIASDPKYPPSRVVDGHYNNSFIADEDHKKWPFYIQIDLEDVCDLANIQTSWYIVKGSEAYYTYTVEGSRDGINWTKLLDHTDKSSDVVNSTYGFNSDMIKGQARYVRLNVTSAVPQNNPDNNWYTPRVYEVKIYGKRLEKGSAPKPVVSYDFETSSGGKVPDISGSGGDLTLHGTAALSNDSEKGSVLRLYGSADDYAQLPSGLLDGCHDYTVVMDARSDSEGDFFTFAAGQDKEKYIFYKVAKDHFRFQTTTDTWRGETGFRYDLDGTKWHRYVLVVNGSTGTLYVDGQQVAQDSTLSTHAADLGTSQSCYIGLSYYPDDIGFTGSVDNFSLYRHALTPAEVAALGSSQQVQPAEVKGDVNADGAFNAADLVAMERFLLGAGELKAPAAGDLIADGITDTFDLIAMRRLIIQ